MAVEVGPFHQGQQLGGGAVQQAAVRIAPQHHPQAEPAGAAGHQQGFRESAAFEQLDIDAIHHRGQAQQVGQIPAALIGHQGQGRQAGQGGKAGPIGHRIGQGGEGLFHQHHPLVRQPGHHRLGRGQVPAAVGIHLQLQRPLVLVLAPGHGSGHGLHQGAVVVGSGGAAELEFDAAGGQLLPPALEPRQHRRRLP